MKLKHFAPLLLIATSSFAQGTKIFEDWDNTSSKHFYYATGGNDNPLKMSMGGASSYDSETKVLKLTLDTGDVAGAYKGPNVGSNDLLHFGTYAARIRIPNVSTQPKVGAVVGFFTYYNDEWASTQPADINENGLHDNSEIDFEWLVADPQVIYLSAYTDFHGPTGEARKVSRVINLAKGKIYYTKYAEALGAGGINLTGDENSPESIAAIEGFDASAQFYTYGFDWKPNQIRWWIIHPQTEDTVVLWDYKGPQERITQKPASFSLNFWHTQDWSVITQLGTTERPKENFSTEFDWVSYTPMPTNSTANKNQPKIEQIKYELNNKTVLFSIPKEIKNGEFLLYDIDGKVVLQKWVSDKKNGQLAISLPNSHKGYFWKLKTDFKVYRGTFNKHKISK